MRDYSPPMEDIAFLLRQVFEFDAVMSRLPGQEEMNADMALAVLEAGGRYCADVAAPLNRIGDIEGCMLDDIGVRTPTGFKNAWKTFVKDGWPTLSGDPDFGGQGLPRIVQLLFDEMLAGANMSFGLYSGLTHGAIEAIAHHGSEELKALWLPKLISGTCTGVMALTEPAAGTDLGLIRTRAEPSGDGTYRITGSKIFITAGDHDFGGNIVHLVLARLPDAVPGVKGISLFLVPKFIYDLDGASGGRNSFSVGSIEKKMGIRGQATCAMNYENAAGWLVGEAGRGLNAMFTMMNAERLFVAMQGLGLAEAAVQRSLAYARERLQGKAANGEGPIAIIHHGDVKRMHLTGKAFIEAARALAVWTALEMEKQERSADPAERHSSAGFVALLTPVIKASFTDMGFETTVLAQQVFGGHGYITDSGIEQFVRDARITQIYEGTNGIQALDLLGRKLLMDNGELPFRLFRLIRSELSVDNEAEDLKSWANAVDDALSRLEDLTRHLMRYLHDIDDVNAAAHDYLQFFALVCYGWMWVRMARAASLATQFGSNVTLRKHHLCRFFVERILPRTRALDASARAGSDAIKNVDMTGFV
ncbi:acyl-CoA dehydrogenase C-terminal domain-containing protein [Rhizobium sp. FKL33]|uniref:acyl-CoA dehydrogenase C-terminal domain-containing protein n=1 Tax=Rhizobium sp. FKL33 TaxID=2562307 RepID=UPI0010C10CA3|nr:acyl-CoA dehydrogenase C-terminal domain-containing protein [Rhizobium sp. FKL33]